MSDVEVFSTCPQSPDHGSEGYLHRVIEAAQWSEAAGCTGTLVYTDNRQVDPWLVAQVILQNTSQLSPLVAVQPIYMHPYAVAKLIASCGFLHRRRVYLNMVAGGFRTDLHALDDQTPHDRRYSRLVEYTTIIRELLRGSVTDTSLTYDGEFYKVKNLKLHPPLDVGLMPGVFVSGSSAAGLNAVHAVGATAIHYPKPAAEYLERLPEDGLRYGARVGVIARHRSDEAWRVATERFPEDRGGQLTHQVAMKVSDSEWHQQLSDRERAGNTSVYWLRPFANYQAMCPYLVGTYEQVAEELARYIVTGYRTFILDIPSSREELEHTSEAFARAGHIARSEERRRLSQPA